MQNSKNKFKFLRNKQQLTRRSLLFALGYSLVSSTTLFSCSKQPNAADKQATSPNSNQQKTDNVNSGNSKLLRVVRSKQLSALAVLEKQGTLEKRLEPLGYKVEWPEFAAGPQQLEALNAGGLNIASTAESPPIFSQSAGVPIVYLAANSSDGKSISLLVPTDSPVKSVKDLKGKKVAFQKASIGHYLILRALEKEGLKLSDVESVYLQPSDANAAFTQNKVDAWFIWEPFVTRNVQNKIGRVLIDGSNGLRDSNSYITTTREFYQQNPEVIKVLLEELQKAQIWSKSHPKEMAQLLSSVTQLDPATLEIMHEKYEFKFVPITEQIISKQQQVADKWYSIGLIPNKVNVRDGFLSPEEYAQITPKEVLAQN